MPRPLIFALVSFAASLCAQNNAGSHRHGCFAQCGQKRGLDSPVNAGGSQRFWPIYDAYQRDHAVTNRRRALAVEAIVGKDENVSDLYARNLANELIATDEAEIRARRTMHNRLMRVLPPMKAAQYLQLESKIRAVQDYDIASAIPLVR